jgi:uncharacterized protein (DUF983 family)
MGVARNAYHHECGMQMIHLNFTDLAAVLVAVFVFHLAVQNAMAVNSSMSAHAQCSRTCACIDMTFCVAKYSRMGSNNVRDFVLASEN